MRWRVRTALPEDACSIPASSIGGCRTTNGRAHRVRLDRARSRPLGTSRSTARLHRGLRACWRTPGTRSPPRAGSGRSARRDDRRDRARCDAESCFAAAVSRQSRQARGAKHRKRDRERRALAGNRLDRQRSPMRLGDRTRHREPEPGSGAPVFNRTPGSKIRSCCQRESRVPGRPPRSAPKCPLVSARRAPPSRIRRVGARSRRGCRTPAVAGGDRPERKEGQRRSPRGRSRLRAPPPPPLPRPDGRCRPVPVGRMRPSHRRPDARFRGTPRSRARRAAALCRFDPMRREMSPQSARSAATGLRTS